MKTRKVFFLFAIFVLLASCQFHQSNFSKRKFLDLKKIDDKEIVSTNNEDEIGFEEISNNSNLEEELESNERATNSESEYSPSSDIEIPIDEVEISNTNQITNTEKSENINHPQKNIEIPQQANVSKKENPKTADQYFKLASLIFLLGLLLILIALTGLFKSMMSEEAGFVLFFLGLIALVTSAIYTIKASNQRDIEKSKRANTHRRDFVLFFTMFFVGLALILIHGKI